MKCVRWDGNSIQGGWIRKDTYGKCIIDGDVVEYVVLHYPDGSSIGGFEGCSEQLPEGAVEMPQKDISLLFEEKVKQLRNEQGRSQSSGG